MANEHHLFLTLFGVSCVAIAGTILEAQSTATARPKFEVASIRLCTPDSARYSSDATEFALNCLTLRTMIEQAYVRFADGRAVYNNVGSDLLMPPIVGGPPWIESDTYTIRAKAESTQTKEMRLGPMMQRLLEDRFKLRTHRETRKAPIFELTVLKSGSKLKLAREGTCSQDDLPGSPYAPKVAILPPYPPGEQQCHLVVTTRNGANTVLRTRTADLREVSVLLSRLVGRPVVDSTGVTGKFDIRMEFGSGGNTPGVHDDGTDSPELFQGPSLFTALQDQLGLKLLPAVGDQEFLVIDHIEKPSEN